MGRIRAPARAPSRWARGPWARSGQARGTRRPRFSRCRAAAKKGLLFSVLLAADFLRRCLSTAISSLKETVTAKKKRLVTILVVMSLAALAGACCGIVQLTWRQRPADVLQIGFSGGSVEKSQRLTNEVMCLAAETDTMKKPDDFLRYCWPFQEAGSEVLIQGPAQMPPQSITVQQSSERASPLGTAISAPRDLAVCGLAEEGEEATLLGTCSCSRQEKAHQSLPLQNGIPGAFPLANAGDWSISGTLAQRLLDWMEAMGKLLGRWWPSR